MYNLTAYDNATTLLSITRATNDVSDGYFFIMCILLVGFFVIFISLKSRFDTIVSMMGASFIISLVAVGGWGLELTSLKVVFYPLILLIGSILFFMLQDG